MRNSKQALFLYFHQNTTSTPTEAPRRARPDTTLEESVNRNAPKDPIVAPANPTPVV